jgi:hypothetical protein
MDPIVEQVRLSVELRFLEKRITQLREDIRQSISLSLALDTFSSQASPILTDLQKTNLTEFSQEVIQRGEEKRLKVEQLWARRDAIVERLREIGPEGAWRRYDFG